VLCRFTLRAGLTTCLLEADLKCNVQVDFDAVRDTLAAAQVHGRLCACALTGLGSCVRALSGAAGCTRV